MQLFCSISSQTFSDSLHRFLVGSVGGPGPTRDSPAAIAAEDGQLSGPERCFLKVQLSSFEAKPEGSPSALDRFGQFLSDGDCKMSMSLPVTISSPPPSLYFFSQFKFPALFQLL